MSHETLETILYLISEAILNNIQISIHMTSSQRSISHWFYKHSIRCQRNFEDLADYLTTLAPTFTSNFYHQEIKFCKMVNQIEKFNSNLNFY